MTIAVENSTEDLSHLMTPISVLEEYVELLKELSGYSDEDQGSVAAKIAGLPEDQQTEILKLLPENVAHDLKYSLLFTGRRKQAVPEAHMRNNLFLCGRAFGDVASRI